MKRVFGKEAGCPVNEQQKGEDLPISELLFLKGLMARNEVSVLKDNGCNTNFVSIDFFRKHRKMFTVHKADIVISHSQQDTMDNADMVIRDATVHIGDYAYTSNFAIDSCRYDILLGMPWHVSAQPTIDYKARCVKVNGMYLPLEEMENDDKIRVTNISVKKFRSLLQKRSKRSYQVFGVQSRLTNGVTQHESSDSDIMLMPNPLSDTRLQTFLKKYMHVFRDSLPRGLPPKEQLTTRLTQILL